MFIHLSDSVSSCTTESDTHSTEQGKVRMFRALIIPRPRIACGRDTVVGLLVS